MTRKLVILNSGSNSEKVHKSVAAINWELIMVSCLSFFAFYLSIIIDDTWHLDWRYRTLTSWLTSFLFHFVILHLLIWCQNTSDYNVSGKYYLFFYVILIACTFSASCDKSIVVCEVGILKCIVWGKFKFTSRCSLFALIKLMIN